MTDAARKQRERDKRRAAGLVRLEFWVPSAAADEVKQAVAELMAEQKADGKD